MKPVHTARTNPFPGLRPFRSDEHHLFFGREEQTAALLQLLRTNRFLAVVGTSGSGKSSLVRAGMIAALHGGTMTRAGSTWEVMILRPGGSPIENLARALVDAELYDPHDPATLPRLLATLGRSRFGLVEAMRQSEVFGPGTNLLVVVDQFEELFRFRQQGVDSEEAAAAFVNLLLTASQQAECPIYVAITMRSDYLGDCSEIPGLAEAVNEGEYLIPRLLRDQKRDAIENPIGVGGARISPLLVQRLLNDVGDDPDQLPVLQHTLMRTWAAWSASGDRERPIEIGDFEATGGLASALSNHADEVYDALPDGRHRTACERIFKALTVKGEDNRGIRRPTRLARLRAIAESDNATVTTVLDAFRSAGVTFLMPGPEVELGDRTVVDLSHESLMRGWQRLRGWVEDEAQSARIFRRLSDTARLWREGRASLFRNPDLQIALSWRDQQAPNAEWAEEYGGDFETAIGFLEASQAEADAERQAREASRRRELDQARELAEVQRLRLEQQQRSARGLRRMIVGLAVVALIAGVACVVALIANRRANALADDARRSAQRAEQSKQETQKALGVVESQKSAVEGSLSKAEAADKARAAADAGRKLTDYTTDMRLAPFVWSDDRTTAEQLRTLLAKHVPDDKPAGDKAAQAAAPVGTPDLRGFEWHYYQHLLERSATVFSGHSVAVVAGAFMPDGQLVTLDQKGQVRRWDPTAEVEDEQGRRDLPGGASAQVRALSPDGRLAALAEGTKVRVLDTSTGREAFAINSTDDRARERRVIFSRDGDKLVILDDKVRWYSALNGEAIASLPREFNSAHSLALSADGLTLAYVGYGDFGNQFLILRLDTAGKEVTPLARDIGFGGTLGASALSPDGRRVAVGAMLSGAIFVFDTTTGRPITALPSAHASPVSAIAFSGDGAKLATADTEGTIKMWGEVQKITSKSAALLTLKGHRGAIATVAFSADGNRLGSVGADRTARVWDLENPGVSVRPLDGGPGGNVSSTVARFSPDGQWIAAAAGFGVRLWDAGTGHVVREFSTVAPDRVHSVAFSPTDRRLVAVGFGGPTADGSYVALWDIDAGTELARLPGAKDLLGANAGGDATAVGALAFSPDGKYLVAGFGSKYLVSSSSPRCPLKVWDVASRRLVRRPDGHEGYCVSLDFSKDGKLLVSGGRDGTAVIWSTETWRAVKTLHNAEVGAGPGQSERPGMVEDVSFAPDGRTLALASREGSVQLWDVAAGELLATLKGHASAVQAVAFSPDGRTLASGGADQTVRLWNVEARRELMRLDPGQINPGQGFSLAFSPDGRQLLVGGAMTAVWSAEPVIWNDPERAAEKLRPLLRPGADFKSRIRMLSENLRLHEALAKLDANDMRVQAALAAAQANRQASRKAWPEAAAAYDRLVAADPAAPDAWLRTPGLLRVAMALLQQGRARDAAALLTGGTERRTLDGLYPAFDRSGFGVLFSTSDGGSVIRVSLMPGYPGPRNGLVSGDTVLKLNGTELTGENRFRFGELLGGKDAPKMRLTVRHAGSDESAEVELKREQFVNDIQTGELLHPLRVAVNERLERAPHDPALLELRAELAGQWSDAKAQAADYTAAIEALSQQAPGGGAEAKPMDGPIAADLKRLYGRRGNAYVALKQWQHAVDDYARVLTDATTDEVLQSNQALATAEGMIESKNWTVLKPIEATSEFGTNLSILPDDSILASGENPAQDRYHVILTLGAGVDLAAVRLEALTDVSLPASGPGRNPGNNRNGQFMGSFGQMSWNVTAEFPNQEEPITLKFDHAWADHQMKDYPIKLDGHWNIAGEGEGRDCTAIWALSKPVSLPAGTTLTFVMQCHDNSESLGHFRLSVSSDSAVLDRERKHLAAKKLADPWQKLATAYRIQGKLDEIDRLVSRRSKLAGPLGDLFVQGDEADRDWQRAAAIYGRGITEATTDVELLSKRARAFEALGKWESAAADWSRAATGANGDGPKLLADFARRLAANEQVPLARVQYDNARAAYEVSLAADPESELIAGELAQVLLDKQANETAPQWRALKPSDMKSTGGATLTRLDDQSILSGGTNPDKDTYTVVAETDLPKIAAVRVEALTHESLGNRGPGRAAWGNFALSNFIVVGQPLSGADRKIALKLLDPRADFEQYGYPVTASLDGNPGTAWAIDPLNGRDHSAVYEVDPSQPSGFEGGTKLTFTLDFQFNNKHAFGRFRLSVSGDPGALDRERRRLAAMRLSEPWARLGAAYAMDGRHDQAVSYLSRALQRADGYEARRSILKFAAEFDDLFSTLTKGRRDDPQARLASARQLAERGKQRLAAKEPAEAQVALEKSLEMFRRLRAEHPEPRWTILAPTKITSEGGATLTVQADGSILAGGTNPDRDVYTFLARPGLTHITAVRLEALPDPSLPANGPGRADVGNFHLNEVRVSSGGKPSALTKIIVAYSESEEFQSIIDGKLDEKRGWSNYPRAGRANAAVIATGLRRAAADDLKFELYFSRNPEYTRHNLGRFRLSVTGEDGALDAEELRNDINVSEVADLDVLLAKAHAAQGQADRAAVALAEALGLAEDRAGRAKVIAEAAALDGVLERLAERTAADGQFQAELARHFAERGNAPLADAAGTRAHTWFEEKLAKEPENSAVAAELAQVLLSKLEHESAARWTVLRPTEMKSKGGATLTLQSDGSILASGNNVNADVYTISTVSTIDRVATVRLEALPDPSLPSKGPGRHPSGNFQLSAFRLYYPPEEGVNDGRTPLSVEQAWASFDYKASDADITGTIDERLIKVWHVWGRFGEAHQAVFRVRETAAIGRGRPFIIELRHKNVGQGINLGRFRISVSGDPDAEQMLFAAMQVTDPWAKLAGAYQLAGEHQSLDRLLKHRPAAAAGCGDLYAAARDWERAIAEYGKAVTDRPADGPLLIKVAAAYQAAGRTRDGVPYLARASAADPKDTLLSLRVAAFQAWFGQEKELADTRRRVLAAAKETQDSGTAERAAKVCSIRPSTDKAELAAALAHARMARQVSPDPKWDLLALGMAEYRSGNDVAADEALGAAARVDPNNRWVRGASAFYRAMILFRQGKPDEARKLAIEAAGKMKPLPADEQNPLTGDITHDDLILWLAYKEARDLIEFNGTPRVP